MDLESFGPGVVEVRTSRYAARLQWSDASQPTATPLWGRLVAADGRTLDFEERVAFAATTARGQMASEAALAAGAPTPYRVALISAAHTASTPERVEVELRFAFAGAPAADENLTGLTRLTFTSDTIFHEYGYRFPAEVAPGILVNDTFAFSTPYASHLSIHPAGNTVADDGESLDGYATWESYKAYGLLFRDAASSLAFDLHRVNNSGYTNYLANGRLRATPDGAYHVTVMNNHEWQRVVPAAALGDNRGVAALDAWAFPDAAVAPFDLAQRYATAAPPGGGGGSPIPPPPNDRSVWSLHCPHFPTKPDGTPCERVVVAVLDSGTNPYHAWFRRPAWTAHPSTYLDGFPADASPLALTFGGDVRANRDADAAAIAGLERGRLYTIPGTNIIGAISFGEYEDSGAVPLFDETAIGHGTGTSSAVVAANPDALLVIVEIRLDESFDDALRWVTRQPWIDVVSLSMGSLGNVGPATRPVGNSEVHPEALTRELWEQGRLVVVAGGNDGTPILTDSWDAPPWNVAVGGAVERANASYGLSAKLIDVVSDHRQVLPFPGTAYGLKTHVGTSFSTPRVAGTLSRAILDARIWAGHAGGIVDGALALGAGDGSLADGRLTNAEVRAAMNATATWFEADAFELGGAEDTPVAAGAPWAQMGWGYVGPSTSGMLSSVLTGAAPTPERPATAAAWMGATYEARAALWATTYDAWAPLLEERVDLFQ